ncbi:ORF6C domain-containing protein [Acinetobacter sp. EC115]|nr:ORF6C domain-containing protein [Acinetobacter rathckeae]
MNANQIIKFNKQDIPVFFHNNKPYVAMKPICENIGLNWDGQRQRIQRNHILSQGTVMITAPSKSGNQEYSCLPIGYLNGWLFGIDVNRVKPEIKDTLIKYQLECYDVLYNHFMPKVAGAHPNTITLEQQQAIKDAVVRKVQRDKRTYQSVYREFYNVFDVPRYQELPLSRFEEALKWLGDGCYKYKNQTQPTQDILQDLYSFVERVIMCNEEMRVLCESLRVIDSSVFLSYANHLVRSNVMARELVWKYDFKNRFGEPLLDRTCRYVSLSGGQQLTVKPNWFDCQA